MKDGLRKTTNLTLEQLRTIVLVLELIVIAIYADFYWTQKQKQDNLEDVCKWALNDASTRDSLTIIENEPRCARYIK